MTKITIEIVETKPFIKLALNGLTLEKALSYIQTFEAYVEAAFMAMTEKMPALVLSMTELVDKAQAVVDSAQDEFEALDPFQKVKSVANAAKLVSGLPKVPAFMKQAIADIKTEFDQLKELANEIKTNQPKLVDQGKLCVTKKKFATPSECYYCIYPFKG
jgi:hypothetical protein